jgi:hypothetical protein
VAEKPGVPALDAPQVTTPCALTVASVSARAGPPPKMSSANTSKTSLADK